MSEYEIVVRFGSVDSASEIFLQVRSSFVPRVGERLNIGSAFPKLLEDPGPLEVQSVVHGPVQVTPPFEVRKPRVIVVVPDPGLDLRRTLRDQGDADWMGTLAVPEHG